MLLSTNSHNLNVILRLGNKKTMRFDSNKVTIIRGGPVAQPYEKNTLERTAVKIELFYTAITHLVKGVETLCALSVKHKINSEYIEYVNTYINTADILTNIVFDKTRIKSLTEKQLFKNEFRVRRILPLVWIDGLFFLTDKRLYFQPIHSIYAQPIISIKYSNITQLFKRRYKLMHVSNLILNILFLCVIICAGWIRNHIH
jgi:hypothetical protein